MSALVSSNLTCALVAYSRAAWAPCCHRRQQRQQRGGAVCAAQRASDGTGLGQHEQHEQQPDIIDLAPQAQQVADPQQQRRQRSSPPSQRQQVLLSDQQQLWAEIEAAGAQAEELESSGRREEAIEFLIDTLARLEQDHAVEFDLVVLRQMLWDALYAAERHRDALVVAAQVFSAVQDRFGKESAEVQLVSVRLGISSAACGRLEAGLKLIYDAAPVLQHNLGRMVEQAQAAAAAEGGLDEQAAATLQDTIDKLAAALGEANYYGSIFTIRHAAATQRAAGVVEGWQELQAILVSGFASLMATAGGPEGSAVANALREHDRLAHDMGAEPLLARLVKAQNEWLHEVQEQGPSHPIFQQIASAQLAG